jgi:rare lipoprotein A (peptidoglycan hydrolase)
MRRCIARGLMSVLVVVSLGAAQGPTTSGSIVAHALIVSRPAAGTMAAGPAKIKSRPYEVGTASWYGNDFEGKPTASGEPYNMFDLTAAHPTLPLGTWVRVTNLHNGRAVNVRINDRGPIIPGRIIDLSYGAATALHFKSRGLQRVRLDIVPARESQPRQVAMLEPLAY